jgi:phospholipid transport system substrate-binding protein
MSDAKRFLLAALRACAAAALLLTATAAAAQTPPDVLVRNTSEEVLATIRKTTDQARLQQLAEAKVAPHFNFERMTRLAVGRAWQQATPEQRQRLQKEFRDLLVRTYTNAVAAGAHSQARVQYKPLRPPAEGDETVVRTQVTEPGRPSIAIDYSMEKGPEGWKVYDVTVDNISLVTNYRGSFASTISQSGIDGLINDLAEKNRRNRASGTSGK